MSKKWVLFALFLTLCSATNDTETTEKKDLNSTDPVESAETPSKGKKSAVELYRNLFKMKRKDQIRAIENLLMMDDIEKKHKMIGIMMKTIIKTISHGKEILTKQGYKAGDPFPEKNDIKDGLSMVLENTALFTDLVVRFPFIAQHELKQNFQSWTDTVKWAKMVCKESGVYVEKHEQILHSLGQELGLDDPDPEYENPFKIKPKIDPQTSEERIKEYEERKRKEKLAAKKNKKKGSKSSKTEL